MYICVFVFYHSFPSYPSIYQPSIHLSIHLSIYLSIYLFFYLIYYLSFTSSIIYQQSRNVLEMLVDEMREASLWRCV